VALASIGEELAVEIYDRSPLICEL